MEAEERMNNIVNNFKANLAIIASDAVSEVYSEILPHVENDTFMNVQYRSQRVVENMIAGKFTVVNENTVRINDDNDMGVDIKVTDSQWDNLRISLLSVMPACPKDLEIASLKKQLKFAENNGF